MLKRIAFPLCYLFASVVFFEIARVFFLLYQWPVTRMTPASLVWQSLWYGLKMDISMAAYICIPVCLFVTAGVFLPFFNRKIIYSLYTGIVLLVMGLLIIIDAEIFKAWGSRIDFTPLKYLSNPAEVKASVSHLPVFWIAAVFVIVWLLLFLAFNRFISRILPLLNDQKRRMLQLIISLVFMGMLIVPIRGGIQLSPINQSSVYFCNNQFANTAAVNAPWNFFYSITHVDLLRSNPYNYMDEKEVWEYVKPLYQTTGKTEQVITAGDSAKVNIILIVWESFTEKALHVTIDNKPVTPYFQQLVKEGIYFSNCYSSGDRTDKGISAVISSYPALPKGSIVNYPEKTAKLPGLGEIFLKNKFETAFYYGGESEFANIKSYLSAQQFQKVITKNSFGKADMNSKWGVHDDVVMKKIIDDLPGMQQPFFTTWLTLSSHEPYETPVPAVFRGNDNESKFLSSLHYTDSCIYAFIAQLKKMPEWENTVVIITADHGHPMPATGNRADNFRIPVLWMGGALQKKDTVIKKTVSQLDIAGSLVHQLHLPVTPFQFSNNMFDSAAKGWAFFTYNDGAGFVTDSSKLLFDHIGKRVVYTEGKTDSNHIKLTKALQQAAYDDFLKK